MDVTGRPTADEDYEDDMQIDSGGESDAEEPESAEKENADDSVDKV